jgi:hypothetical protein
LRRSTDGLGGVVDNGLDNRLDDKRLPEVQRRETENDGEQDALFHYLPDIFLGTFLGTGSCPAAQRGWHRASRLAANQHPAHSPWQAIASAA